MAQHDQVLDNGPGASVRADMNNALAALFSSNSGSVEPTVKVPGQLWFDTAVAGATNLKIRNQANSAWDAIPANVAATFVAKAGDTMTGDLIIDAPGGVPAQIQLDKAAAGQACRIRAETNNVLRWTLDLGNTDAEGGANGGSAFDLRRYDDAGTLIESALTINRASGLATFARQLNITAPTATDAAFVMSKPASTRTARIRGQTNGVDRWAVDLGNATAEAGGGAGSDFAIRRHDDAGAFLGTSLLITRDTDIATFDGRVNFGNNQNLWIDDNGTNRIFNMGSGYDFRFNPSTNTFTVVGANTTWAQFLPGGNFTITGAVGTKASGTTWANPSDERLKDIQGDYTEGLDAILGLQPRVFQFKPETGLPVVDLVGLIAQEAEEFMPDLVTTAPGVLGTIELADMKTLDASNITWALLNAVKELSAKCDALEARIVVLESA